MTAEKQIRFWLIALVVALLALFFLRAVLLPFVLGMAIAYLLDPICDRLETWRCPRWLATTLAMLAFFCCCLLVVVLLVPVLVAQIGELAKLMPGLITKARALVDHLAALVEARTNPALMAKLQEALQGLSNDLPRLGDGCIGRLGGPGRRPWPTFSRLIIITPVVAFYLLRDWDKLVATIDSWLPRRHIIVLRRLAGEVDGTLAGFIRGQGAVCLLLGAFYAIGLTIAGAGVRADCRAACRDTDLHSLRRLNLRPHPVGGTGPPTVRQLDAGRHRGWDFSWWASSWKATS